MEKIDPPNLVVEEIFEYDLDTEPALLDIFVPRQILFQFGWSQPPER